jgi:hypothetical protein
MPGAFQALATPWVETTVTYPSTDDSAGMISQLMSPPNESGLAAFDAAWFGFPVVAAEAGEAVIGFAPPLTPGTYHFLIGELPGGTLDFEIDGNLIASAPGGGSDPFPDVELFAGNAPVTYDAFNYGGNFSGTDPTGVTPEPGTLLLMGLGLPGVLFWRRRKRG